MEEEIEIKYMIIRYKKRSYKDQKENIKRYMEKNREKINEKRRERYKNDNNYREEIKNKRKERYEKERIEKEKDSIRINYQRVKV